MSKQRRKISLLIYLLVLVLVSKVSQSEEVLKPKSHQNKSSEDLLMSTESKNEKSEKELRGLLEGLSTLIKTEKPSAKKNELILSRSAAYLNLAKYYRIKTKTPGQFKKSEEINLKNAIVLASEVEKSIFADSKQKARSLHLQGMSYTFLHNDEKAIAAFSKALIADKNSPVNPRLSIYIAEYLYDKERYLDALPKYSEYFAKLSPEEKALAIFKSGWCFILTKQYSNAEKTFLKIIGKKWAGDFATDAVRDVAYAAVSHMQEQEIINFGRTHFGEKDNVTLVDFYTEAYRVMVRESSNIDRPLLYNEILKLDPRPERKVVVSLKRLSTHQREYAADVPYQEMFEIKKIILASNLKPSSEAFKYFASEFELEIKKLIKAYADTSFQKVKSVEKFSVAEISKRLSDILMLHIEMFPDSASVPQSYALALENCIIIKDAECTLKMSRDILKMDSLKTLWGRAQLQLLGSLETLSQKDPQYKDQYFDLLLASVKNEETTPAWLNLAKKLTAFYIENKKFTEAYPFLEKIYKKEQNSENLYRQLYCAYELKNYDEVVAHAKLLPAMGQPFHSELLGLFRESSIILAQDSARGDDFNKYEEHLTNFLKLNTDETKADVARSDYFQRLLSKEQYDKLFIELQALPAKKIYSDPYKKTTEALLMTLFKNGKSREVLKFLASSSKLGMYPEFNPYWFKALWVAQPMINKKDQEVLAKSNPKDRASIIAMLTLSRPEAVVDYFADFPAKDDREKKILLLSLQIKEGSKEVFLAPKYFDMLQSILPPDLLNTKTTISEKLVGYVEFPQVKWSEKKLEKVMPDAVSRIRTIRAQVLRDVVGKSYSVQKRILTAAITSELRMVDFFKAAPVPQGLTAENLKVYKDELASVATEFAEQAGEYQKMLDNIEVKIAEMKKDDLAIPKNMSEWPKPSEEVTKLIDAELALKNAFGALLILESQRALAKISDENYYSLRAYTVFSALPNAVSAKYIQDELMAAKQVKLIEKWKELSSLPEAAKRGLASEKGSDKKRSSRDE